MAELKVRLIIERNGEKAKQFDCFSEDENDQISKRLSGSVSAYYSCNYNELGDLDNL